MSNTAPAPLLYPVPTDFAAHARYRHEDYAREYAACLADPEAFCQLLQGLVEIVRCVICLQTGAWPAREDDVEEVDVDKLKEMVHVKDSDIDSLDRLVVQQQKGGQP